MPKSRVNKLDHSEFIYEVLDLYDAGNSNRTRIAKELGLSRAQVSRILLNYQENREQILHREVTAWKMRQAGKTHQEIADALTIERSTVTKILKRLSDRVILKMEEEVMQAKVEQWGQFDWMVSQLFSAWLESKEPNKSMIRKQALLGERAEGKPEGAGSVESRVDEQDGNPVYLREAREAMADLRKLLGMDAPYKFAPTDPSGNNALPGQVMIFIPENSRDQNPASAGTSNPIPGDAS